MDRRALLLGGLAAAIVTAPDAELQNLQAGAEFDKAYLEAQLQGHRDLLQVQERYLQSSS